jgi:hypothetical protein
MTSNSTQARINYQVAASPELRQLAGMDPDPDWDIRTQRAAALWALAIPEITPEDYEKIYGQYPFVLAFDAIEGTDELVAAMRIGLPRPGATRLQDSGSLHHTAITDGTPVWGKLKADTSKIDGLPFPWGFTPDVHINVVRQDRRNSLRLNPDMQKWLAHVALMLYGIGRDGGLINDNQIPGIFTSFVGRYLAFMRKNYGDGVIVLGTECSYGSEAVKQDGTPDKDTWTTLAALDVRKCIEIDKWRLLANPSEEIVDLVEGHRELLTTVYGGRS